MSRRRSQKIELGVMGVGIVGMLSLIIWGGIVNDRRIVKYQELYNEVVRIADTNKDGLTSYEEWGRVYKKIGLQYDVANSRHSYLNLEQLERIVSQHR